MIDETMTKALLNFAVKGEVEVTKVGIWIKPNEDNSKPIYFKSLSGVFEKTDEGQLKTLDFTKDILDKKFDPLQKHFFVANFITKYFESTAKYNDELELKNLSVMIGCNDSKAKDLKIGLFHSLKFVKWIKLDDIIQGV